MPSFRQVLEGVDRAWREQRAEVEAAGRPARRRRSSSQARGSTAGADDPTPALLDGRDALRSRPRSTPRNGGWGRRAEVPAADDDRVPAPAASSRPATRGRSPIARRTLDAMADGGIHDQLGGGFHRYATDAHLARPALRADALRQRPARAGLPACLGADRGRRATATVATGDARLHAPRADDRPTARSPPARTPTPTASRALTFTWTRRRDPRGPRRRRAALFVAAYGVTDEGNWEGVTILSRVAPTRSSRGGSGSTPADVAARLAAARARLLARAGATAPAGPRRQGARGLERAGDRRLRRRRERRGVDQHREGRTAPDVGARHREDRQREQPVLGGQMEPGQERR